MDPTRDQSPGPSLFVEPRPGPDQRRSRGRAALGVLAVVLTLIVAVLQRPSLNPPPAQADPGITAPAAFDPQLLLSKMYLGLASLDPKAGAIALPIIERLGLNPSAEPAGRAAAQLRLAVYEGEAVGPEAALERLAALLDHPPDAASAELVAGDLDALTTIYEQGPSALSDEQRTLLEDHHGWFGRVALTHGLPGTDPARASVIDDGLHLLLVLTPVGLFFMASLLAGVVLLTLFLVAVARGRVKPAPAASASTGVLVEVFCLFLVGFLLVQLASGVLAVAAGAVGSGGWVVTATLAMQWSLVAVLLWPLARGVRFGELRRLIGWHSGRGLFREVGVGVLAWMAGLPLMLVAAIMSMVLGLLLGADTGEIPENPVIDLVGSGGVFDFLLIAGLVVVWAPVVEESVFRGALFRSLRPGLGFAAAGVISAAVFALVHSYPIHLLPMIALLGFNFAVLGHWRGSLLAPMTAHFLQNALAFTILTTVSRLNG